MRLLFLTEKVEMDRTMLHDADKLNDRINVIFKRLFQARPESLGDHIRRGELQRWDSLGHLELVSSLEREFHIEIPTDEVLTMETVGDVRRTVEKLSQKPS
jgi:acyl carrier protein